MTIKTTVIGSFLKPDYLKIPDWFQYCPTGTNVQTIIHHVVMHKEYCAFVIKVNALNKLIFHLFSNPLIRFF